MLVFCWFPRIRVFELSKRLLGTLLIRAMKGTSQGKFDTWWWRSCICWFQVTSFKEFTYQHCQRVDDEMFSIYLRAQQQGIIGNQTPQITNKNSFCNSSLTRHRVTRNSSNGLQWFECRKYSQRAFSNHAEIFQHETLCIGKWIAMVCMP